MKEERKDYAVYGMKAKCSEGTMENYITTDTGHGVTYQGNPLLNANDHTKQVNLTHFGDCNAKQIYEQAKAQADEKYKAEAGDGLFTLAGKFIAKTVTKDIINRQEYFMFHKCELDTPLPWMFCNDDHMIDGAPALTLESQCTCRFGGIITIVPAEEDVEAVTEEVIMEPVMAPIEPATVDDITKTNDKSSSVLGSAGIAAFLNQKMIPETYVNEETTKTNDKSSSVLGSAGIADFLNGTYDREELDKVILETYVNEETLLRINSDWDIKAFKDIYGDNVFEEMRDCMFQYGITNSTSILMFLSTMGVETGWGKNVIQGGKYEELESAEYRSILEEKGEIPEIESSLGIGLVQVTGENQGSFIRDLYQSLPSDSPERAHIEEYFGVTEEYMMSLHSWEPAAVENAAGYIYMYYPVEASTWYWAQWKDRRTTINDFIVSHKDDNLYNTFMCTQMMLNGTRFVKEDLDRFAGYETNCVITTSSKYKTGYQFACPDEPEKLSYGPNGWGEREKDWNSAQGLLNEKANKE